MSNPRMQKRQRELERLAKQRTKEEKRRQRQTEKVDRPPSEDGVDPDIASIVPGVQPPLPD